MEGLGEGHVVCKNNEMQGMSKESMFQLWFKT
jgi:hypothetical protein